MRPENKRAAQDASQSIRRDMQARGVPRPPQPRGWGCFCKRSSDGRDHTTWPRDKHQQNTPNLADCDRSAARAQEHEALVREYKVLSTGVLVRDHQVISLHGNLGALAHQASQRDTQVSARGPTWPGNRAPLGGRRERSQGDGTGNISTRAPTDAHIQIDAPSPHRPRARLDGNVASRPERLVAILSRQAQRAVLLSSGREHLHRWQHNRRM